MSYELEKYIDELENELEELLREKNVKELNFVDMYNDPMTEWNYRIMFRVFDLIIQVLFPEKNVEKFIFVSDTPLDQYHIELKKLIEFVRQCQHVIVVREYDTIYYCIN